MYSERTNQKRQLRKFKAFPLFRWAKSSEELIFNSADFVEFVVSRACTQKECMTRPITMQERDYVFSNSFVVREAIRLYSLVQSGKHNTMGTDGRIYPLFTKGQTESIKKIEFFYEIVEGTFMRTPRIIATFNASVAKLIVDRGEVFNNLLTEVGKEDICDIMDEVDYVFSMGEKSTFPDSLIDSVVGSCRDLKVVPFDIECDFDLIAPYYDIDNCKDVATFMKSMKEEMAAGADYGMEDYDDGDDEYNEDYGECCSAGKECCCATVEFRQDTELESDRLTRIFQRLDDIDKKLETLSKNFSQEKQLKEIAKQLKDILES